MNMQQLATRLAEEGCNPTTYAIGLRGDASDALCLVHNGGQYRVFYTERGQDSPALFTAHDEASACQFLFEQITAMHHLHCVGIFREKAVADALEHRLVTIGVSVTRDEIPYEASGAPRFRVFVEGKAVFPARAALGEIPLRDDLP